MRKMFLVAVLLQLTAVGCTEDSPNDTSEMVLKGPEDRFAFEVEGRAGEEFNSSFHDFGCVMPFAEDTAECYLAGGPGWFQVQIVYTFSPSRQIYCRGGLEWGENLRSDYCIFEDTMFDLVEAADLQFSSEHPIFPIPEGTYTAIGGYFHSPEPISGGGCDPSAPNCGDGVCDECEAALFMCWDDCVNTECGNDPSNLEVFDCDWNCVSVDDFSGFMGNGVCDSSFELNVDCAPFEYERGDCTVSGGGCDPNYSLNCGDGICNVCEAAYSTCPDDCVNHECGGNPSILEVWDCDLNCVSVDDFYGFMGDGVCNSSSSGPNVACAQFEYELGDCPVSGGGG